MYETLVFRRGIVLLIRYRRSDDGKPVAKALVYTKAEHGIGLAGIDPDAVRVIERLRENGHEAYIVGGAVRDLLLGREPKDFDIATDAQPARIRRIFKNSRVIGRRFRLVHIYAGQKIFEVSTFRSIANGTVGNEYGTIDEDALRRDFTLNALYFDPHDLTLVDYVGGFKDIHSKRIKPVIPLKSIFREDPVRMIRCVKYAAVAGFRIPLPLRMAMRRDSSLLAGASPSRLTEEFLKILASGKAADIFNGLATFGLLHHILPEAARMRSESPLYRVGLDAALAELDEHASNPEVEKRLALLLAHYLRPFLECRPERFCDTPEAFRDALHESRLFLAPLNPPRVELEAAVLVVFKRRGVSPLQKPRREGRGRGEGRRQGDERSAAAGGDQRARRETHRPRELDMREAHVVPGDQTAMPAGVGSEGSAGQAHRRRKRGRRRRGGGGQAPAADSEPS
jgi:poly(A) polymerase